MALIVHLYVRNQFIQSLPIWREHYVRLSFMRRKNTRRQIVVSSSRYCPLLFLTSCFIVSLTPYSSMSFPSIPQLNMQSTLTAGDLIALGALSQLSKAEQVTKAKNKAAVENLLVKALAQ